MLNIRKTITDTVEVVTNTGIETFVLDAVVWTALTILLPQARVAKLAASPVAWRMVRVAFAGLLALNARNKILTNRAEREAMEAFVREAEAEAGIDPDAAEPA